jgi:hypothetical protein
VQQQQLQLRNIRTISSTFRLHGCAECQLGLLQVLVFLLGTHGNVFQVQYPNYCSMPALLFIS